jgi:hypothetical protein
MKKDLGFDKKLGDDKWNPADMWILSPKGKKILTDFHNEIKKTKTITVTDMNKLNLKIMNAYNTKDIFPVSLKAPAGNTVNYSLINYTANNKDLQIVETFKFRGLDEMKRMFTGNLLNNRDVKIPFVHEIKQGTIKNTVSKGNIKLKTGNSGGYRLEIEYEKGGAKGGSIGTENWQFLISKINRTGVDKVIDSRKEASTNIPKFGTQPIWDKKGVLREGGASQDTNWFGGLIYKKLTVENQKKLIRLLNVLLSKIDSNVKISPTQAKNLSSTYIFDKTSASELAVSIIHSKPGKVGENIRNTIAESLFDLASSRKFAYKQFDSAGKAKLTTLMNSCFHIKLY